MKVLIVARDAAAAEAIRRAMRYAPTCRVIGWVDSRNPCAEPIVAARPDAVLVDESAGSQMVMAWAREIRAAMAETKIVLLIRDVDPTFIAEAEAAGVDAAIAKTATPASVGMLVREVVAGHVFRFAPAPPEAASAKCEAGVLTARELEILEYVAAGCSNGRIASELWVTEQTVKFHLSNVYRKLGLANRTEAAHFAYQNGLVSATRRRAQVPVAA
jgi:DNA-binding NarL/FixJ family response regulator